VLDLPRLPVFGWSSFAGPRRSALPSILDRDDVLLTTSGRAAIALALRALDIGPGDRVLVPTYHCPTMIAPVVALGALPVFFPIDGSGAPALDLRSAAWDTPARVMIAAHYFGLPQPMANVRAFCDARGIALIEDCAHALFGRSGERDVGRWGDYAIASLTKFLPVVDGGCLAANAGREQVPALARQSRIVQLRSAANAIELGMKHRRLPGLNAPLRWIFAGVAASRGNRLAHSDEEARFGTEEHAEGAAAGSDPTRRWLADFLPAARFTSCASAWTRLIARHAHRERIVALRRRNYALLASRVTGLPGVRAICAEPPADAAPYVFPLWVDEPERIYQRVRKEGIPVFRWDEVWPSCPDLEGDRGKLWSTHVFQLGCHQDLSLEDVERIASALAGILADADRRTSRSWSDLTPAFR
jgi:dTDP-4-amino-4,6-dideoxygalactose transaminase